MNSVVDWINAGDGALYAGDPGGEPHEPETGTEAGTVETTPFGNRKGRMKNQNCHFSRTDPFTIAAEYDYGPFGELFRISGPMSKDNPFRFSTKYTDDESDADYYGYRYYR